ncbi:hypothetical protein [uncultured Ruegeria sp.]|uniref:hypothetical protein n=1 Tax=uncultured Ruegeria sp. TaxID=259304 RepID=UPI002613E031|nr:hypothetical protein [uncultured Ruegeria sp.]
MKAPSLALVFLVLPICASAQDLMRSFEMPAHHALIAQRDVADLTPFETDGCSGGLSTSWRWVAKTFPQIGELYETQPPWEDCCMIHDRAYHNAGGALRAEDSYDARLSADETLRSCVRDHGDSHVDEYAQRYDLTPDQVRSVHSITADAMFGAVRFGGGPCSGLPWRWGFGYAGCSVFAERGPARE